MATGRGGQGVGPCEAALLHDLMANVSSDELCELASKTFVNQQTFVERISFRRGETYSHFEKAPRSRESKSTFTSAGEEEEDDLFAREKWILRVHKAPCQRRRPSGTCAVPQPWSLGVPTSHRAPLRGQCCWMFLFAMLS